MDTQKQTPQKQTPQKQTRMPGRWAEAAALFFLFLGLGAAGLHAATQTTNFEPAAATVGNARLLTLAVTQYTQDYDEKLPDTRTAAAFDTALRPYVPDPAIFTSRVTGKPFIPNAAISGKSISAFSDPSIVVLFSDAPPPSRVPATVGFLDGHIERGGVVQLTPSSSYDTAKALALGVIQYTQDNDAIYPTMKTQAEFQAAVLPYARNSRVFVDPANAKPFLPNPALSQVAVAGVSAPSQTVLFQSSMPYTNGVPTVAYADGHVTPLPPGLTDSGRLDAQNLSQIGLATAQFTQDNDEVLPTTTDCGAFENALFPYLRTTSVFTSPGSGLPYVLNPAISGVNLASISDPSSTEEARDAKPNADGILNRLQVSGQVKQDFYFLPLALLVTPDDQTHLLWRSAAPQASLWTVPAAGGAIAKTALAPGTRIMAFSAGADGQAHLLGGYGYGAGVATAADDGGGTLENLTQYGVYDGWTPSLMTTGRDNVTHLLWQRTNGQPAYGPLVFGSLALWTLSPTNSYQGYVFLPNLPGGTPVGLAAGSDGFLRLLWKTVSGDTALWMIFPDGRLMRQFLFSSPAGQIPTALSVAADGTSRLLWSSGKDTATVRTVTVTGKVSSLLAVSLPGGGTATQISVGRSGDLRLLWNAADGSGRLQTLDAQGSQTGVQPLTPYL